MVVGSEQDRGGIKQITTCFIVRLFRKNEHPFFRLITIFFFSYITWSLFSSSGTLPRYLWTSHFYLYQMAITTSVPFFVTIHHIPDGLLLLHVFFLLLLLYKCIHALSFRTRQTQLLSVLTSLYLLFPWMNISAYDFFLPNFSYFVYKLDLITYFLDLTSSIFTTYVTVQFLTQYILAKVSLVMFLSVAS